ncbi:MAG: tyrosine--tRNA ligase [Planctomycetota bacterium]
MTELDQISATADSRRCVLDELIARGLMDQMTDADAVRSLLQSPPQTIYAGFDPTADSLHVGHLVPVMALAHLQRAGHCPIMLVGGATGMIGDPSGKSAERNLLTDAAVAQNANAIKKQLERFLSFDGPNAARMVNNLDWIGKFSYIDWLREVGKLFTVNYMMAKESVKRRLEDPDKGISYTEFSYQLLQAYDFLHLFRTYGCSMQIGGSDQWGNITAGLDLIRKTAGQSAQAFTLPLVTTSDGSKFGKTAGNAVWMDANRTSPYKFYQYWMQTPDADIEKFLKYFTFLPVEQIDYIVKTHQAQPEARGGQKALASEITRVVHREDGLASAMRATDILFGKEISGMTDKDLSGIFDDVPSTDLPRALLDAGVNIIDLLATAGVCKSKGDARRQLQGNAVNINNRRISDIERVITPADLASETALVVRLGKKNYHLVRFKSM